jgi:signal peptidase I
MNPTILEGDLIFVNKAAYDLRFPLTMWRLARWADPERGEIVVCFSPEDDTRLVKRVIGLPGDSIYMVGNRLVINGVAIEYTDLEADFREALPERFKTGFKVAMEQLGECRHPVMGHPGIAAVRDIAPFTVPEGKYFVLGDNRDMSRDSRVFGFVDRELIVGRAKGVIISFDKTDKYQPRFKRFFSSLD